MNGRGGQGPHGYTAWPLGWRHSASSILCSSRSSSKLTGRLSYSCLAAHGGLPVLCVCVMSSWFMPSGRGAQGWGH